jgi:hypothetical protein
VCMCIVKRPAHICSAPACGISLLVLCTIIIKCENQVHELFFTIRFRIVFVMSDVLKMGI